MKVFVALEGWNYEGTHVLGIYSSKESLVTAYPMFKNAHPDFPIDAPRSKYYMYELHDVDGISDEKLDGQISGNQVSSY